MGGTRIYLFVQIPDAKPSVFYGVDIAGVEVAMFWASTCPLAPPAPHQVLCRSRIRYEGYLDHYVGSLFANYILLMRPVVSYDDLEQLTTMPAPGPPPAKKRKRQQNKRKPSGSQKFAHWDEPAENHDVPFTGHDYAGDNGGQTTDTGSRELTHEEIWDDSALIEAWDSAMDEYKVCRIFIRVQSPAHCVQAFHGSENEWKTDPISKPSAL